MRRAVLLPLLLLWSVTAGAQEQRAFLALVVNGVEKGDALIVLRGDDALVEVERIEDAGVHGIEGRREQQDGQRPRNSPAVRRRRRLPAPE